MGYAYGLNSDLVSNIEDSAVFTDTGQISDTEIILTKDDARIIKGENTIIHRNRFMIDSVEVEIFTNSNSNNNAAQHVNGVTIAELVNALHYLEMNPERIIHFLQSAVNTGMIKGRLLLK